MANTTVQLQDLEAAEVAYERVKAEIDAVSIEEVTAPNVDIVSATSIALGVSDRILVYRDRIAKLGEFDVRCVDNLVDYAKAAWYVHITNLPIPEPADAAKLTEEVVNLRAKLLRWAVPLVEEGQFEESAVAKIKEGSGAKDAPSDLVALVGLYRSKWDAIKNMCSVTEEELARGAQIGPAVFAMVSRREQRKARSTSELSLQEKRAWTLLDRAYSECRDALQYLRRKEKDVDLIAPSLRKNSGTPRHHEPDPVPTPSPSPNPPPVVPPVIAAASSTGPVVGTGSPFAAR